MGWMPANGDFLSFEKVAKSSDGHLGAMCNSICVVELMTHPNFQTSTPCQPHHHESFRTASHLPTVE